jgi:hypothetical protein
MGGHAVVFYGVRRTTSDIDILVQPTIANGERILKAFKSLKLDITEISAEDFATQNVFTFGMEPDAVDILTYTLGVDMVTVFKNSNYHKIDDMSLRVVDLRDLLKNKESLNRKDEKGLVDQQDILALRRILKKK